MLLLPLANRRARKSGWPPELLLAVDAASLHALDLKSAGLRRDDHEIDELRSWPRSEVTIERAGKAFMRDRLSLHVPDEPQPVNLFVSSLTTNPWSSEVVRLLGGEAPDPMNLSS